LHWAPWRDFATRFAYSPYRQALTAGLRQALLSLQGAGCRTCYVDGSFVTSKHYPNDWDGCWNPAGVDPTLLDPVLLQFDDGYAQQKARFEGHFYISSHTELNSGMPFLEFFQSVKETGEPKGIIALDLGRLKL